MTTLDGEELYRRFFPKVQGYIRARVQNQQDAEDLCSTVFMKVYAQLDSYDESRASLSTWIYAITRNTVADFLRLQRPAAELDETLPAPEADPELEGLADALEALPARERDLVILHYYHGLSLKEVAGKMGLGYSTVKLYHSQCLRRLERLLTV